MGLWSNLILRLPAKVIRYLHIAQQVVMLEIKNLVLRSIFCPKSQNENLQNRRQFH